VEIDPRVYRCDFKVGEPRGKEDHEDARLRVEHHLFQPYANGPAAQLLSLPCPRSSGSRSEQLKKCIRVMDVEGTCKPKLRQELASVGIDDFATFGDMDHLARRLRSVHLLQGS
jgi:hypothetical protein